jgi:hypothetical protein
LAQSQLRNQLQPTTLNHHEDDMEYEYDHQIVV